MTTRRYYEVIAQAVGAELRVRSLPSAAYAAAWPEKAPFAYHRVYSVEKLAAYAQEDNGKFLYGLNAGQFSE